jgi:peptide/nickel transport system ATP-binding protein
MMRSPSTPLLQTRDLRIELNTPRGRLAAVRGVDICLERGQTLGLMGESGCGKSLTALALMGLLPESASVQGSLRFQGQECLGQSEDFWCRLRGDRMAMVFQEPMTALNPLHPIGDQVAEPMRLHRGLSRTAARERAIDLLERVGIHHARQRLDAYPHQFSGGQRQRIMIAMALACDPELLIADEPTTALDVTVAHHILGLIRELVAERGMGLVLISHDLNVLTHQVQHLAVMYCGQVVESGPTHAVLKQPLHPYTRGLMASRPQWQRIQGLQTAPSPRPRLHTIPGQVPELHQLPLGCSFAPRCRHADATCEQAPDLLTCTPQHRVRCWKPQGELDATIS